MARFLPSLVLLFSLLAFFATPGIGVPVPSAVIGIVSKFKLIADYAKYLNLVAQIHAVIKDQEDNLDTQRFLLSSVNYCGHHDCPNPGGAYYDAMNGTCICPWAPIDIIRNPEQEQALHPDAKCFEHVKCRSPFFKGFDPFIGKCVCTYYLFPPTSSYPLDRRQPNMSGTSMYDEQAAKVQHAILNNLDKAVKTAVTVAKALERRSQSMITGSVSLSPLPTFVPPPKTDITPALIQQSLAVKPQQNAIVHSVVPHFADGVITFYVQLDGPIPQSLQLNATDSMPCDVIGSGPDPNLILVPHNVNNGTPEVVIPDCLIIAVNKLNATWINYWVQKNDGSGTVHSLLGDAQVHNIDQLDTSKPAALSIRVSTSVDYIKRAPGIGHTSSAHLKRQQVFAVDCDDPCLINGTSTTQNPFEVCGCLLDQINHITSVPRSVDAPNVYNAVMTAQACAFMTCINNGGKPALFNPFSKTCWCAAPTFIETDDLGHAA